MNSLAAALVAVAFFASIAFIAYSDESNKADVLIACYEAAKMNENIKCNDHP